MLPKAQNHQIHLGQNKDLYYNWLRPERSPLHGNVYMFFPFGVSVYVRIPKF